MDFTNHTILLTGATSGIGRELAQRLHRMGNQVIACGRRADKLAELAAACPGLATRVCDVDDAAQREQLATWATVTYPALNVLVNNAGQMRFLDLTQPVDLAKVTSEVTTNLLAPVHLSGLLVAHLQRQPTAAILNVTSGLAFTPLATVPVYCATKAGLHAYCLSLRYQLRHTSVKVFELIPPPVATELGQADNYDRSHDQAMSAMQYVEEVLEQLAQDCYEVVNGMAVGLHEQRDNLFGALNPA